MAKWNKDGIVVDKIETSSLNLEGGRISVSQDNNLLLNDKEVGIQDLSGFATKEEISDIHSQLNNIKISAPDYSAGTTFSSNADYIAPSHGLVAFVGTNSDVHTTTISVNTKTILTYANNAGYDRHTGILPIKKGDVIKITTSGSSASITNTFYPYIGL